MNGKKLCEMSSTIARLGLMIAGLLVPILICIGAASAQSPASSQKATNPAVIPSSSKPAGRPASHAKGPSEGITVHGHWVVEVRNPDGTVTARRDFENSIQPGGQSYLASMLAGSGSPGGLSIAINGAHMSFSQQIIPAQPSFSVPAFTAYLPQFSDAGPCQPLTYSMGNQNGLVTGGPASGTTCLIAMGPTPVNGSIYETWFGSICNFHNNGGCSLDLAVELPSSSTIILGGNVSAFGSGNINDVETLYTTCSISTTPSNCLNLMDVSTRYPISGAVLASVGVFTQKTLDSNGNDPAPVPYAPGQTIAVTVTISFQ
jgi:hypothetical protein